jgi:hypothetical protein
LLDAQSKGGQGHQAGKQNPFHQSPPCRSGVALGYKSAGARFCAL